MTPFLLIPMDCDRTKCLLVGDCYNTVQIWLKCGERVCFVVNMAKHIEIVPEMVFYRAGKQSTLDGFVNPFG
ncbi:hypothetical protein DESC_610335 [Desulfosarcina cetonica]|nr:hypothetical protein DESC_610335 [Desulfosarcina cetonica]